ncbi:MAG: hypothetical protein ACYS76_15885 [Planctomycetota bacterium]
MTSRERMQTALNHQEPDRIPVDLGGSIVSSITKNAYSRKSSTSSSSFRELKKT